MAESFSSLLFLLYCEPVDVKPYYVLHGWERHFFFPPEMKYTIFPSFVHCSAHSALCYFLPQQLTSGAESKNLASHNKLDRCVNFFVTMSPSIINCLAAMMPVLTEVSQCVSILLNVSVIGLTPLRHNTCGKSRDSRNSKKKCGAGQNVVS